MSTYWQWLTSNNTKRLTEIDAFGRYTEDGGVLHAEVSRDGVPTICVSEKDMCLIEAAPDLLEACKVALAEIEETKKIFAAAMPILVQIAPSLKRLDMSSDSEFIETLRAAIDKAEGRS